MKKLLIFVKRALFPKALLIISSTSYHCSTRHGVGHNHNHKNTLFYFSTSRDSPVYSSGCDWSRGRVHIMGV